MKIYLTRHGQTDYNKQELILGITDIPLNDTGIAQAHRLAEEIERIGGIDFIIASPMIRADITARTVADRCGLEIITDDRLREWDYGEYEGKSRFTDGFAENKREFAVRMGNTGESVLQLSHRVYSFLDEIIEKYSDKNILLVSHGGICRIIETYFNNMTTEQYSNWFMGNCQLIEYNI
ncbi:MAG: histidine phosphatase family protein [Ruminococcus flavefaciens]|nr:histidine phosphatase family protein [Ruminococcus flavefaciens]MCM1229714.1 histidine phosphatase family protein [Ruminococcus flavefaciens]